MKDCQDLISCFKQERPGFHAWPANLVFQEGFTARAAYCSLEFDIAYYATEIAIQDIAQSQTVGVWVVMASALTVYEPNLSYCAEFYQG